MQMGWSHYCGRLPCWNHSCPRLCRKVLLLGAAMARAGLVPMRLISSPVLLSPLVLRSTPILPLRRWSYPGPRIKLLMLWTLPLHLAADIAAAVAAMGASVVDDAVVAATALDTSVVDDACNFNHRRGALQIVCRLDLGH